MMKKLFIIVILFPSLAIAQLQELDLEILHNAQSPFMRYDDGSRKFVKGGSAEFELVFPPLVFDSAFIDPSTNRFLLYGRYNWKVPNEGFDEIHLGKISNGELLSKQHLEDPDAKHSFSLDFTFTEGDRLIFLQFSQDFSPKQYELEKVLALHTKEIDTLNLIIESYDLIPHVLPFFAGKSMIDSTLNLRVVKAAMGVIAKNKKRNEKFDIVYYEVIIKDKPYTSIYGARLHTEAKKRLSSAAKIGDVIEIKNIITKSKTTGKHYRMPSLKFNIVK